MGFVGFAEDSLGVHWAILMDFVGFARNILCEIGKAMRLSPPLPCPHSHPSLPLFDGDIISVFVARIVCGPAPSVRLSARPPALPTRLASSDASDAAAEAAAAASSRPPPRLASFASFVFCLASSAMFLAISRPALFRSGRLVTRGGGRGGGAHRWRLKDSDGNAIP